MAVTCENCIATRDKGRGLAAPLIGHPELQHNPAA